MKKIVSVTLMIMMILSMFVVPVSAASPIKTKNEAIAWLNAQQDKTYNYDNAYGTQCTEFVKAYVNYVMTGDPWQNCGYAVDKNGRDVWQSSFWKNNGWTVYNNTADFMPQPGDIFSAGLYSYGHTGVVISSDLYTAKIAHANGRDNVVDNGDPVTISTITWRSSTTDSPYGATHFIRPNFKSTTTAALKTPVITFNKSSYTMGDTIKIAWGLSPSNSNLSHYWITVANPAGNLVINQKIDKSQTTFSFATPGVGTYKVTMFATPYGSASGEGSLTDTKSITINPKVTKYTVYFNANGGSGAPAAQTKYHNQTLTLSSTKPTRSGYIFLGWSTSSTATSATYAAGGPYTANSGATLYAVWAKNTCRVYFNANGGYCPVSDKEIPKNSAYGSLPSATRDGYNFDGWYTRREGGTRVTSSTVHTSSGNITLYAHWSLKYPSTPELISAANTASGVKVSWKASANADSYIVYRKTYNAKTKAWSGWSRIASGLTSTAYTDKNVKTGTYYRYTVKAVNEAGNSGYNATGFKTYFLSRPTVTTSNSNSGVTVKWTKSAGATGYVVYRKTTAGWTKIATVKGAGTLSYTDKKASSGTTYKYTVRAYYSSYLSAYKESAAITRLATPTLKSVTSAQRGITIKWNKVTGATGYIIYRKTGNGSWKNMGKVTGTTVVDTSAKRGATYTYTIRAYYGNSTSYYNTKGLTIKDKY